MKKKALDSSAFWISDINDHQYSPFTITIIVPACFHPLGTLSSNSIIFSFPSHLLYRDPTSSHSQLQLHLQGQDSRSFSITAVRRSRETPALGLLGLLTPQPQSIFFISQKPGSLWNPLPSFSFQSSVVPFSVGILSYYTHTAS
ncbi:hypothetical protein SLA2020_044880 [Shorea laevis]